MSILDDDQDLDADEIGEELASATAADAWFTADAVMVNPNAMWPSNMNNYHIWVIIIKSSSSSFNSCILFEFLLTKPPVGWSFLFIFLPQTLETTKLMNWLLVHYYRTHQQQHSMTNQSIHTLIFHFVFHTHSKSNILLLSHIERETISIQTINLLYYWLLIWLLIKQKLVIMCVLCDVITLYWIR